MPIRASTCPSMPSDISNFPKATGWIRFSGWWFMLLASHGGRTKSDKAPCGGRQHEDMAECRGAWIHIVFWGETGVTLPVSGLEIFLRHNTPGEVISDCVSSVSISTARTGSQGSHRADSQQRGSHSHELCCRHSSLAWDKVRTYIHWLLVLNILLISKTNWRSMLVTSLGVVQLLPWNMCALPNACKVAVFLPRRTLAKTHCA